MVSPAAESKINALKQEYAALGEEVRAVLASLKPEDLTRRSGNPAWTVGVVAGHLAKSPAGVVKYTKNVREGKGMNYPQFIVDAFNWFDARSNKRMTVAEMGPKYDEGHAKLAADIEASAGDNWERRVKVMGQEVDLDGWFRMNMDHEREHLADLKAGLS
jgi:DinB superfamily